MRHIALGLALLLGACGYHLVGHGDGQGAIPASVKLLNIQAHGEGMNLALELKQALETEQRRVRINAAAGDAQLQLQVQPPRFAPSAYDANGVASQYRMNYSGSLRLLQQGKEIWQSGPITEQGEVFVSSSPASIEAGKQQLLQSLRRLWLRDAVGRLRSGF